MQHRRQHPGRAVRRRGHDPPAGGVLLVHREREQVDPVHDPQRIGRVLARRTGARYSSGARRGTFSPPGSVPSLRRTPFCTHSCITAQMSSRPARTSASLRHACSLASITPLIGSPVSAQLGEQLGAGRNGYGSAGVVGLDPVGAGGRLVHDETAADRVVRALADQPLAASNAKNRMPFGWNGRLRAGAGPGRPRPSATGVLAEQRRSAPARRTAAARVTGGRGVDGLRALTEQAEDDRAVAAVPVAGGARASRTARPAPGPPSVDSPSSASPSAKVRAARIGPTVCDDDGPMPIENRSNTLMATRPSCALPARTP